MVVISFLLALATSFQYARFDRCRISPTLFGSCGFSTGFPSVCWSFCGSVDLFFYSVLDFCFRVKFLIFLRRILFFACLSDAFLIELMFCHFFGVWELAAFLFCIKFVDDFLYMYVHLHRAFSGFARFKFSIKYFKECFAPHHRLSSQTVAFDISTARELGKGRSGL